MKTIKGIKPSKKSGFVQGYFPLIECKKYQGIGPIIYRSSWERKFCIYCERNPEILSWTSENLCIEYFNVNDNQYHNYFPDFLVKLKSGDIIIVEVKPKAQLQKPSLPKINTKKSIDSYKWSYQTWITNMCKKKAAEEYASVRGWKYMIVTEDFFKTKSINESSN
jgi:hypothetical protein